MVVKGVSKAIGMGVMIAVFLVDRLLKYLSDQGDLHGSLGFIQFENLHNYGATMGFLSGDRWLLVAFGLVVVGLFVKMALLEKSRNPLFWVGMGLLLGGTLGNMVDRVFLGYVTDMLRIPAYPAIFNVADLDTIWISWFNLTLRNKSKG
jgi:signal peptidase II